MLSSSTKIDALDKLKARIQALRAKTTDNGCTEDEALSAAAKVAELLDRHDLSLTDIEIRDEHCERIEFETWRKKRIPLDGASARSLTSATAGSGGRNPLPGTSDTSSSVCVRMLRWRIT